LQDAEQKPFGQYSDTSGQAPDTSQHKKCAISVLRKDEVPADLAKAVEVWGELTVEARLKIIAIVEGNR